jgi:hypothetical protein
MIADDTDVPHRPANDYNGLMPNPGAKLLAAARGALASPMSFPDFLAKLSPKDRLNAERRVGVLEAEPDPSRAPLWRRLASALMTLAPHAAKFVGKQTVQYYVADGKYRKQVFALEDLQDGNFTVYVPDVLDDAIKAGLLVRPPQAEPSLYVIQPSGEPLRVESLDGDSLNPGAHFKDMTGWNRKALRVTLPPSPSPSQVEATETLCAIAAQRFAPAASPASPKPG